METVPGGRWVAEIYGCDVDILEDPKMVEAALVDAVMIHTWPEDNASATLDLYFYRDGVDPEEVLKGLTRAVGAKEESAFRYWRGTEHAIKRRGFGAEKAE